MTSLEPLPEWRSQSRSDSRSADRQFCWSHSYRRKNPFLPIAAEYHHVKYEKKSQPMPIPRRRPDEHSPLSSPEALAQIRDPGVSQIRRVRDIDWRITRPFCAGIVIVDHDMTAWGVDATSREITDFGGGISYRKDKTTLQGALREFSEESHDVFGHFTSEQLQDCYAIYNNAMMIVFLPLPPGDMQGPDLHQSIRKDFQSRLTERSESSDLIWLSLADLQLLTEGDKVTTDEGLRSRYMYHRVRDLLSGISLPDFMTMLSS